MDSDLALVNGKSGR